MAKTSKNILDEARASIKQIDIDQARKLIDQPGTVLIDVRESDEWRQGHIPQAIAIPRGFLELRVEEKVPDHKTPVILQCARARARCSRRARCRNSATKTFTT